MTEKIDALERMIEQYEENWGRQPMGSLHPTWDAILAQLYQARALRRIERLLRPDDAKED